jgi:hypothetical protein
LAKHSEFWKVIKEIAGFARPGLVVPAKSNANTSRGFPAPPLATTSVNTILEFDYTRQGRDAGVSATELA